MDVYQQAATDECELGFAILLFLSKVIRLLVPGEKLVKKDNHHTQRHMKSEYEMVKETQKERKIGGDNNNSNGEM